MESVHDPMKNSELGYSDRPIENSIVTESAFNKRGALIRKSVFNTMGNLEKKSTFKYDQAGNLLEATHYGLNNVVTGKEANRYNSQNKLIEHTETGANEKIINRQDIQRNDDGTAIIRSYVLARGRFVKVKESGINEREQNIWNAYFTNGTMTASDTSGYDANHNRVEEIYYDLKKNEKTVTQYKYDNRKNITGAIELNNNLMISSKVLSKYDAQDNLVETLTYGMLGNVIKHVRHTYEKDDAGNWTRDITIINSKPVSVTLHRIEYY